MQLNITGQQVDLSDALRKGITTKFSKLEQLFDRINQVDIVLKVTKR